MFTAKTRNPEISDFPLCILHNYVTYILKGAVLIVFFKMLIVQLCIITYWIIYLSNYGPVFSSLVKMQITTAYSVLPSTKLMNY